MTLDAGDLYFDLTAVLNGFDRNTQTLFELVYNYSGDDADTEAWRELRGNWKDANDKTVPISSAVAAARLPLSGKPNNARMPDFTCWSDVPLFFQSLMDFCRDCRFFANYKSCLKNKPQDLADRTVCQGGCFRYRT